MNYPLKFEASKGQFYKGGEGGERKLTCNSEGRRREGEDENEAEIFEELIFRSLNGAAVSCNVTEPWSCLKKTKLG